MQIWKQLAHEAEEAFHQGNYRLAANKYLVSYRALPDKWEFKRYQVLRGYTYLFEQEHVSASDEDLAALKAIADDSKELKLYRCEAAYVYGFMCWRRENREEAFEYYRKVLQLADKTKRKERRYKVLASLAAPDRRLGAKMMGDLLDKLREFASLDLDQSQRLHDYMPSSSSNRRREDGTPLPPLHSSTSIPLGPGLTKDSAKYLMSIGGDRCDCCQRTAKEAGLKSLDRCARCTKAWYCSKGCQLTQWKSGHNKCCRKPGEFKADDYVEVKGLQTKPEFDSVLVKVLGPDRTNDGHWEVQIGGGDESEKESVPAANMAQLRPLK